MTSRILYPLVFLLLSASLGVGCLGSKFISSGPLIVLKRTHCFGTCPDYTVTIAENGQIRLRGNGNIVPKRTVQKRIDSTTTRYVFNLADSVRFFELPSKIDDHCRSQVVDLPGVEIRLRHHNQRHKVFEQTCGTLRMNVMLLDTVVVNGMAEAMDKVWQNDRLLAWTRRHEDRFIRESYLFAIERGRKQRPDDVEAVLRQDSTARAYMNRLHTLAAAIDSVSGAYEWAKNQSAFP